MSNLKNNTASLEALLEQANALPGEKKIQTSKTITPTKSAQTAQPDNGYDGLAKVTVEAIPAAYQDVSGVTAVAVDVVEGKVITSSTGTSVTGTNPYAKAATDAEVAEQTGYLNDLNAALDNLVGNIPLVCTVQVAWDGTSRNPPGFWDATLYSYNEEEGYHYVDLASFIPETEPVTVVCGSTMTIKGSYVNQISSVDGGEILYRDGEYNYTYTIRITAPAGSAVTIYGWCSEK